MTLRAVFFDLDGTLLDTAPDLAKALNSLLLQKNCPALPDSLIRSVVSDGAYALLKLGFGVDRDHPDTDSLRSDLLNFYLQDIASGTTFFPGIEALLKQLHACDLAWGIVTNKPVTYAEPLIACFAYPRAPVCLLCPEHVKERKPHPEALELACKIANIPPTSALYIGDHRRDIECGKNAGMHTIAVNYGYIHADDSAYHWGADHVVETAAEIWPIIKTYIEQEDAL